MKKATTKTWWLNLILPLILQRVGKVVFFDLSLVMLSVLGGGTVVLLGKEIAEMGGGVKGKGIGNVGNAFVRA